MGWCRSCAGSGKRPDGTGLCESCNGSGAEVRQKRFAPPVTGPIYDIGAEFTKPAEGSIQQRFEAFHEEHPEVYDMIVKYARRVLGKGKTCGIGLIWERLRWEVKIEKTEEFKLNDHYRSRYSRLIRDREADLVDFFETRALREKGAVDHE